MNIDEMEAGPEFNALIAEKVMEWQVLRFDNGAFIIIKFDGEEVSAWEFNPSDEYNYLWSPTEHIRDAWEVMKMVVENGIGLPEIMHDGQLWVASIRDFGKVAVIASAATASLAICRAALKAVTE